MTNYYQNEIFQCKSSPHFYLFSFFFTSCCFKNEKKGEGMKSFMQKFIAMIFPLSLEAWLNLLFITTHNIIRFSHIQKVIYTYSFFFSSSASFLLRIGAEKKHKTKKERKNDSSQYFPGCGTSAITCICVTVNVYITHK